MEFLELIFYLKTTFLDLLMFNDFQLTVDKVKSSHFYDYQENKDKEFHEISSFCNFFKEPGTGTITVQELHLGTKLEEFVILLYFNKEAGKIVINFSENQIRENDNLNKEKCLSLLEYFVSLMKKYDNASIRFGYESADDDDTCLIVIKDYSVDIESLLNNI